MSAKSKRKRIPLLAWPFVVVWRLVALVLELTGRVIAAVLGLVLLVVGILLSLTVIGAIVGVPLGLFGLLLMVRSIF